MHLKNKQKKYSCLKLRKLCKLSKEGERDRERERVSGVSPDSLSLSLPSGLLLENRPLENRAWRSNSAVDGPVRFLDCLQKDIIPRWTFAVDGSLQFNY